MAVEAGVEQRPTRRNFIAWAMSLILAAFGAVLAAPLVVYIWPPPRKGQKYQTVLASLDKPLDSLSDGDAAKFEAPKGMGFIMKTGGGNNSPGDVTFAGYAVRSGGQVNVFSTTCSHLGCSVAINQQAKRFDCPCHGSRFALNGNVIHGPATAPLAQLSWEPGPTPSEIKVAGIDLGQGA